MILAATSLGDESGLGVGSIPTNKAPGESENVWLLKSENAHRNPKVKIAHPSAKAVGTLNLSGFLGNG